MPVNYRFDSNIVIIEMVGEYSIDDIRATILTSFADPKCPANSCLLINLAASQSIHNRPSENIRAMAHFIATLGNHFNNRIALVAPDDLTFGLVRMGSVGSEERGIQSEVFRTLAEAREWLLL